MAVDVGGYYDRHVSLIPQWVAGATIVALLLIAAVLIYTETRH